MTLRAVVRIMFSLSFDSLSFVHADCEIRASIICRPVAGRGHCGPYHCTAPAPLLPGEAEADYLGVAARIVAVAQPKDAIEEFLTRDLVDLTWEIFRLRRLKAGLLRAAASKGVRRILSTTGYDLGFKVGSSEEFAAEWASGNADRRREFDEMLKKANFTVGEVMAEAFAETIDSFERIDRMLASAEARRNNALREIDRHREALGAAMRRAIDEAEDAEFRDAETGSDGAGALS
jgi:hypothetical protein